MTIAELIEQLKEMPQDANVDIIRPYYCMRCYENSQSKIIDKLCEYNSSGQKMSDFI